MNRQSNRQPPQTSRKLIDSHDVKPSPRSGISTPTINKVPVSPALGKLSISDAIGLITIRLSKVEEFMLKNGGNETSTTDIQTLTRSLSARMNTLESSISGVGSEGFSLTDEEDPHSWNNMKGDIISDMATFKSDLDDIRKLVIKLQSQLA